MREQGEERREKGDRRRESGDWIRVLGVDGLRLLPTCTLAKFYLDLCVLKEGHDAI